MQRNFFRYLELRIGVDHECNRQTNGQTDRTAVSNSAL